MNRHIVLSLFGALAVAVSASDMHAGVFRQQCPRRPACACARPVKPMAGHREGVGTWSVFPTRLSDYGKWPPYYQEAGR